MENALTKALNAICCRELIWDSGIYRWIRRWRNPDEHATRCRELAFFSLLFQEGNVRSAFDIGANLGFKAAVFAQSCKQVVCVEPDPENYQRLQKRFRWNKRIFLVNAGAGAAPGKLTLNRFAGASTAFNTFSQKWVGVLEDSTHSRFGSAAQVLEKVDVPITTVDELISRFGAPDFVKIDVEGFEYEVLKGLSTAVPLVSFECNLPEFKEEAMGCLRRLCALDEDYRFNFTLEEPPRQFEQESWLLGGEVMEIVLSGRFRFMEIYAQLPSSQRSGRKSPLD